MKTEKSGYSEGYQLKITLNHIKPDIWRRFTVSADIKLPDLSRVIQTVMGWKNIYRHQFMLGRTVYSTHSEEFAKYITDYTEIKLNQILKKNLELKYIYDFRDEWEHTIVLEKVFRDYMDKHPVCLEGERCCPPEDFGGYFGYQRILETLSDPKEKQYQNLPEWIGGTFDPEDFDKTEVCKKLKKKNFGCIEFET